VSCQEAQDLLHGYLDGELDLVRSLELEQHLQACPSCSHAYQNQQALRAAVRTGSLYFTPPVHLQKRVRSAVRSASHAAGRPRLWSWRWLGVAASLAFVTLMLWRLVPGLPGSSADDRIAQELIAGHVRSLMVSHLTDVPSSDQHTVKPWFEGKLDFSPPVADVTEQGFPLVGGRLDYVGDRPVAALVYRRQQHVINLFIWPAPHEEDVRESMLTRQGFQLIHWAKAGMSYWVVSDLNARDLQAFVHALQAQASLTTSPAP
jgi:anti-sigma factor (TIGR02949 family)